MNNQIIKIVKQHNEDKTILNLQAEFLLNSNIQDGTIQIYNEGCHKRPYINIIDYIGPKLGL